jgi:hypothetical protein
MCTRARPYGRAGRCGFGGRGVTAWDLSKLTRNSNPHLKRAWGIYTPQKRKLAVGPRVAPVRPVPHTGQTGVRKTSRWASGTGQTGPLTGQTGQARDTPKTSF